MKIYWKWTVKFLEYSKRNFIEGYTWVNNKFCWENLDNFKLVVGFKWIENTFNWA